jgi:hypothetical protein
MAIANYDSYKKKLKAPYQTLSSTKINLSSIVGRLTSLWVVAADAASTPAVAAVPIHTTTGSFGHKNSNGVQRISSLSGSIGSSGYMMITDRLSHQGGLSGIVATSQTTNLPTAPLSRYTSGAGVFMALEIYSAVGTTVTTVTVSYTNSDGVSGRISEPTVFGGTGFREGARMIVLPLQEGDQGVRSVENVTVLATTGTAGNFGVTLFKPLMGLPVMNMGFQPVHFDSILNLCGNMPKVENNACLQWMVLPSGSGIGVWLSTLQIIEE